MSDNWFKCRLLLDPKKGLQLGYKGIEVPTRVETSVEVLFLILPLRILHALLGFLELVGDGVIIHDTHVVNTVCPLRPYIPDQDTPPRLVAVTPCLCLWLWPFPSPARRYL